jgi:hypothetical protein
MPKAGRPPKNDLPQSTFVLDNGGDTIKAGFALQQARMMKKHSRGAR